MNAEEQEIYRYLKPFKGQYLSSREICRRAGGKKKFQIDEEWAKPSLHRMVERGILETDPAGAYRIRPIEAGIRKQKRWVSPQIQRILEASGKEFGGIAMSDEQLDRSYNSL